MRLSRLGEFGLIGRIRTLLEEKSGNIVVGFGDDAAVIRPKPGWLTILTTDAMVEGTHFNLSYTPLESIGWKALAINVSDVAAMGGLPRAGVISLAIPAGWKVEDVESFYRGMKRCAREYGCIMVGGDTVRTREKMFVSVTVIGEVEEECVVKRSTAIPGDVICVTGVLGGSSVGLEVLLSGKNRHDFPQSVDHFIEPRIRLSEARQLVRDPGVSAMIDISDGLSSDIGHLCAESGLGCVIYEEKIPVSMETKRWLDQKKQDRPMNFVLGSGEEYELLFTLNRTVYEKWMSGVKNQSGFPVTCIGEMVQSSEQILVNQSGERVAIASKGWDHFK